MDLAVVERMVEDSDWLALRTWVTSLEADDRRAASTWYRRKGRAHARRVADRDWREHSRAVQLILALALAETAEEASTNCRWGWRFLWNDGEKAVAACADLLVARGRAWATDFVGLATAATFRGESRRGVAEVTALVTPAVNAFALPAPKTETYVLGWVNLITSAQTYATSKDHGHWYPLTLSTSGRDGARPAFDLGINTTLADCLRATDHLSELFCTALDLPDALADWAAFKGPNWDIAGTVRDAIARRWVDRPSVLDCVLRALGRNDRTNNQRVLAQVLTGLDLTPAEARERIPLLLNVVATAHGSVTRTLLDLLLAAKVDDVDLIEFGTVILARPEKAQKERLLAHLATADGGARQPLLLLAVESGDASLAAKARSLLDPDDDAADSAGDASGRGMQPGQPAWAHPVEPFAPGRFEPYPADESGLDLAVSEAETWSRITTEAAYLDLVVHFGYRSLERLRAAASTMPPPSWYSHVRTPFLLHQWAATGDATRSYRRIATSITYQAGMEKVVEQREFEMRPPEHLLFTDRLVEEALSRLGAVPELLSTPSRLDGTVTVEDLAQRVRRARSVGYGPYDLVQALLRLEPTSTADLERFAGLVLPPAAGDSATEPRKLSWFPNRRSRVGEADGVEVIRSWITAGGRAARVFDTSGHDVRASALGLPLQSHLAELEGLVGVVAAIGPDPKRTRAWGSSEPGPYLGVVPYDVEGLATQIAQDDVSSVSYAQALPVFVWSAGPIGPAMHHHLARLLVHPRLDSRMLAAKAVAEIARQGRIDSALLRDRSLVLFEAGNLPLARAAQSWSQVAAQASLGAVWPAWLAVLDVACAAPQKPSGLADLLRATRDVVAVAPHHEAHGTLPPSVHCLAAQGGSAKAVTEARALIATAGGSRR